MYFLKNILILTEIKYNSCLREKQSSTILFNFLKLELDWKYLLTQTLSRQIWRTEYFVIIISILYIL